MDSSAINEFGQGLIQLWLVPVPILLLLYVFRIFIIKD